VNRSDRGFEQTEMGLGESPTITPMDGLEGRESSPTNLLGQVLDGKYEVVRLLGEGGMGVVYEARHTTIGSRAAVKVLHPEAARQPESLARFKREAQAAGTIGHPNIVRVLDIGQTPAGLPYMVMDFVEGQSLAEILHREAPLEPARAIAIAEQILSALGAAHEKGIVHRDVKPENVLISRGHDGAELAKVLDFGISKFKELGPDRQGLTRTGTILGTPLYMAPEQARGETDVDHRIDLYAVGVTLYVMLTGRQPYRASNYNALLIKIVSEEPPAIDEVNPALSCDLVAVVTKAMARDRNARFGTAAEFIDALRGRTRVEPVAAPLKPKQRSSWRLAAVLIVAGVLLAGGVAGAVAIGLGSGGAARETTDPAVAPPPVAAPSPDAVAKVAPPPVPVPVADEQIDLVITAAPADAEIRVDGALVGNPVTLHRPRDAQGSTTIEISADGYLPETRVVSLASSSEISVTLQRRRAKTEPRTGGGLRVKVGND
jgi:eukaryotic-like serine/threonine-protein kinase